MADRDLFGRALPAINRPRQMALGLTVSAGTVPLSRSLLTEALSISAASASRRASTVDISEGEVGARWAQALRKRYPVNTAKLVARDLRAEVRTVEGWMAGQCPHLKFFIRALRRYGAPLLADMADPGSALALSCDLDQIEARLLRLAAEINSQRRGG